MKTKYFIFVVSLCALLLFSVVAIRPSKDEIQCIYIDILHNFFSSLIIYNNCVFLFADGATEESKTKTRVDTYRGWGGGGQGGNPGGEEEPGGVPGEGEV